MHGSSFPYLVAVVTRHLTIPASPMQSQLSPSSYKQSSLLLLCTSYYTKTMKYPGAQLCDSCSHRVHETRLPIRNKPCSILWRVNSMVRSRHVQSGAELELSHSHTLPSLNHLVQLPLLLPLSTRPGLASGTARNHPSQWDHHLQLVVFFFGAFSAVTRTTRPLNPLASCKVLASIRVACSFSTTMLLCGAA